MNGPRRPQLCPHRCAPTSDEGSSAPRRTPSTEPPAHSREHPVRVTRPKGIVFFDVGLGSACSSAEPASLKRGDSRPEVPTMSDAVSFASSPAGSAPRRLPDSCHYCCPPAQQPKVFPRLRRFTSIMNSSRPGTVIATQPGHTVPFRRHWQPPGPSWQVGSLSGASPTMAAWCYPACQHCQPSTDPTRSAATH